MEILDLMLHCLGVRLGQVKAILLALDPGPQGWAIYSWPWPGVSLTLGQSGQARVSPGPALTLNRKMFYKHISNI